MSAPSQDNSHTPLPSRTRTVYFFGAGASAAESVNAPTTPELLRGGLMLRREAYPTLQRFLASWGYSGTAQLPQIEELLSILDTCLARGEPIGRNWTITELTRCREELVACIYELIAETLRDDRSIDDHGPYERLLDTIAAGPSTLITLNYDLLLDIALARRGLVPDYGLDFVDAAPQPEGPRLKLYKLHGSLNWGYCASCSSTFQYGNGMVPRDRACGTCGGGLSALIVPPTPLKVPPSPFLSSLWKKAEWELARTQAIVFIGYALGEADANIRYLLFRGFFGHRPRVVVVQKPGHGHDDPLVMGRYERLFPGGVEFCWDGFEAYVGAQEQAAKGENRLARG